MTSADVVATFDRLLDKEHPGRYYQNVEFIDTVTAPDDYTVVMTLAHDFGAVEDTLTQACTFILNKDYIDQYGDDMCQECRTRIEEDPDNNREHGIG